MGDREARTQDALVCGHTGAAEDAASRRPARPDGTSVIVNRALSRRDVLVVVEDVPWVVRALECSQALELLRAERRPDAFQWLVVLHVVEITAAGHRPRLDRRRRFPRPADLGLVLLRLLPYGDRADV